LRRHTQVPQGKYGNTKPDPQKEVGPHIQNRRASVHDDWKTGRHKNATWVPENKFGRVVADPMAEVGNHIRGKPVQVRQSLKSGKISNATWVERGQHGDTKDNHLATELQDGIAGKAKTTNELYTAGKASNSTWVPENKWGRNNVAPLREIEVNRQHELEIEQLRLEQEFWRMTQAAEDRARADATSAREKAERIAADGVRTRLAAAKARALQSVEAARQLRMAEDRLRLQVESPLMWQWQAPSNADNSQVDPRTGGARSGRGSAFSLRSGEFGFPGHATPA